MRKPNIKDKINLVKNCLGEMLYGVINLNRNQILLAWYLMKDGIAGRCEVMSDEEWERLKNECEE